MFARLRSMINDKIVETVDGAVLDPGCITENTHFKNCYFPSSATLIVSAELVVFDHCDLPEWIISNNDVVVIDKNYKTICGVEATNMLLTCRVGDRIKVNGKLFNFVCGPELQETAPYTFQNMNIGGEATFSGANAYLLKSMNIRGQHYDNQLFERSSLML